ncbi:diguanylate cyclase [Nocardia sp. NPDC004068]|uniref:GGDEF domain-containing protein n=1 Tax=Nocardia sp. NPDC004068 TaxID=3364303 RepID=UPI0036A4F7AA
MSGSRSMVRAWWRDRVDYRWLVDTFASHHALRPMRWMVGSGGALLLAITVLSALSAAGPRGVAGLTVSTLVAVLSAAWALRWWLLPWPSRTESLIWVSLADLAVLGNCLAQQNRLFGAVATVLSVVIGGYVTIFHGPRLLALHVGWSLLVVVALSARLVLGDQEFGGDYALAGSIVLIIAAAMLIALPQLHFCTWLLRRDALSDPLTMLLNRRGLDYYLSRYVDSHAARVGRRAYVITLDLDRFKSVNDTFGHSSGDDALVETAERLRIAAAPDAVVARNGGEEFVVVGALRPAEDVTEIAERLRRSIASIRDLPIRLTASVGVALGEPGAAEDAEETGRRLLRASDVAMYRAKNAGGNTVVIVEAPENGSGPVTAG